MSTQDPPLPRPTAPAAVVALAAPLAAHAEGAKSVEFAMPVSQIWMFHTGRMRIPRRMLEASAPSERCWLPFLCFLVVHPQGPLLVDAGLGLSAVALKKHPIGRTLAALTAMTFEEGMDCRARIRQCGFAPEDVKHGILTHMHWDHAGAILDLPDTRFWVSRRELDFARSVKGFKSLTSGYWRSDWERATNLEPFDWSSADDLDPFDCAFDVFGDGSVRAIPTPGHSPGHLSLLLTLDDGHEVLLAGDAAFTVSQVEPGTGLGFMPRHFAVDYPTAEQTLQKVRAFARRRPDLLVLTSHDPDQGDDVALAPQLVEL